MSDIDASEHLLLINRVIRQMGLYGDLAEEAYSEALVIITEASRTYDSSYGVPVASWLGNNIRWALLRWMRKQKDRSFTVPHKEKSPEQIKKMAYNIPEAKNDLDEIIKVMKKILTDTEYQALTMEAIGYSGVEISQQLGISQVQISRAKQRARKKLEAFR